MRFCEPCNVPMEEHEHTINSMHAPSCPITAPHDGAEFKLYVCPTCKRREVEKVDWREPK